MNGLMRSCRADPLGSTQNERIPIRLAHVKLGLVSHCVVGTRFYQGGDKQDGWNDRRHCANMVPSGPHFQIIARSIIAVGFRFSEHHKLAHRAVGKLFFHQKPRSLFGDERLIRFGTATLINLV